MGKTKSYPLLEIAVFNVNSAIIAEQAGADRIELCENPSDGGTTASYGTLKTVREKISIPVFPIIRPRGGDFLYTAEEFEVMKQDITLCKTLGFEGVVTGMLNKDGSIDYDRMSVLTGLAYPLEVTFHRAFDRASEPFTALTKIIATGCHRILTSGQVPNAIDNLGLIKNLIETAQDKITIMPGSGIRSGNITEIVEKTAALELHSSARTLIASKMSFIQNRMQEDLQNISVDRIEIKAMKIALKQLELK